MTTELTHSPRRGLRHMLCAVGVLCVVCGACRRDLWVYTDEFCQVALHTDWSEATETPGGMTWWFMSDDLSGINRHGTTADIAYTGLNMPRGRFSGVVFDYSPSEYSHVTFEGMTRPDSALVLLSPSADQPLPDDHLYGSLAVPAYLDGVPQGASGMYSLAAEPEPMNADTLNHVLITAGIDEELIHWEDRDKYTGLAVEQHLHATPRPIIWTLCVRLPLRGASYMYSLTATVAGLADGCWLLPLRHTATPCLQLITAWQLQTPVDTVSYLSASINTFGLRDNAMPRSPRDARTQPSRADTGATPYDQRLRLNLQFLLRDEATVLNYHYDITDQHITIDEDQLLIYVELPTDIPGGIPDLPAVDAKGTAGFDATVTPWADGEHADATM